MTWLWEDVEWDWYARGARGVLYWHWSPNNGWALEHEIRGWNECLITYVLAAGAPRYPIDQHVYHRGFATGRDFLNGRMLLRASSCRSGRPFGGPLFFAHYSFCGLDPRGLEDRYASYWEQNLRHVRINHAHCVANPNHHPRLRRALLGADGERRSRRLCRALRPTTTTARSRRRRRSRAFLTRPRRR